MRLARRLLTLTLALPMTTVLSACPSGESVHGVEHPTSARVAAGKPQKAHPTCRGGAIDAWAPERFCVTRFASDLSRPVARRGSGDIRFQARFRPAASAMTPERRLRPEYVMQRRLRGRTTEVCGHSSTDAIT